MTQGYNASLEILFDKMDNLLSSKTVVGEPLEINGITLIPLIEVSMGVGAGGKNEKSGVGGMGAKIIPSSLIVLQDGNARVVSVKNIDAINRIIDMVPEAASKLGFSLGKFGKDKDEK